MSDHNSGRLVANPLEIVSIEGSNIASSSTRSSTKIKLMLNRQSPLDSIENWKTDLSETTLIYNQHPAPNEDDSNLDKPTYYSHWIKPERNWPGKSILQTKRLPVKKKHSCSEAEDGKIIQIPVKKLEQIGQIQFEIVKNDNTQKSLILLTKLKCVIQKQLKYMPKEYVARIVYDLDHTSIVIVQEKEVVGGATFRHFFFQKFTELTFVCIAEEYRRYVIIFLIFCIGIWIPSCGTFKRPCKESWK